MKMPFGKHRGEELEDVPTDYLEWCLRELDADKLERNGLGEEMENQIRMRAGQGATRPK